MNTLKDCLEKIEINPKDLKELKIAKGIYFLLQDGFVIYVGQSVNLHRRIPQHNYQKYDKALYIETDGDLDAIERKLIAMLQPAWNFNQVRKGKI